VIIHVVDASNPQAESQMETVYDTLGQLGVMGKPVITLLKQDGLPGRWDDRKCDG
jgi:GTP-binding protein HflX